MFSPYTITSMTRRETKDTAAAQAVQKPLTTAASRLPAKWPYYVVGGMVLVATGLVVYKVIKNRKG